MVGVGGMVHPGGGVGCLSFKAAKVTSFEAARVSSEHAKRTAPLKSPSSSFADTRRPRDSRLSLGELLFLEQTLAGGGFASSLSCLLIMEGKDLRWPPLIGTLRQRGAK